MRCCSWERLVCDVCADEHKNVTFDKNINKNYYVFKSTLLCCDFYDTCTIFNRIFIF